MFSLFLALTLNLNSAVVIPPPSPTPRERKAVAMLVEEVEKRSAIRWKVAAEGAPSIRITRGAGPAEGYSIRSAADGVAIAGNGERGVLFGIGRLLRALEISPSSVELPEPLDLSSAPRYPLRGHQLGYRPKTNSYDGWTVAMWEQYIRDLAVFGANAVELIPPRSDDDDTSPHFPLPPLAMMREMSRLLDEYGLDVWIWYPALEKDYTSPAAIERAMEEWGAVFRHLPRVDAVFVPGGDPGHTPPKTMLALLERQAANLRRYHPKAGMWMSPQGFSKAWMDEFLGILRDRQPDWLAGIVYGPQVRGSIRELRAAVPQRYPIRHYPDITHTRQCQFPVPDWDPAYALTEAREPINPRPLQYARIFRLTQPSTIGFIAYSEGCNDDVNKIVWSALGWDPDADVVQVLREYSRYFIGPQYADTFAQGILALERNWQGPLAVHGGVYNTLRQFQALERAAAPRDRLNWRFQQALYRAYYDAYTRRRLLYETELEEEALERLRQAARTGSAAAMSEAEAVLDRAVARPVAEDWRGRIFELAEALYQSVRMQLSVARYQAIAVGRGANLDTLDEPLNSRPWLKAQFTRIRRMASEQERLEAIGRIVNRTDPGPGGFYDDLGDVSRQPRLVKGKGFDGDPQFLESALMGVSPFPETPFAWTTHAQSLREAPLEMRYPNLDPAARYRLRVVYAGDSQARRIRLTAGNGIQIHPLIDKKQPPEPVEFAIPPEAVRDGELRLRWTQEEGLGGNGRGCQVAEVWLIREPR
ncbi:MAG: hypothetical protein IT158_07775 [Bryobacterales bacterium]|nr:hypothetical protein [Bryobacterales bacterium]